MRPFRGIFPTHDLGVPRSSTRRCCSPPSSTSSSPCSSTSVRALAHPPAAPRGARGRPRPRTRPTPRPSRLRAQQHAAEAAAQQAAAREYAAQQAAAQQYAVARAAAQEVVAEQRPAPAPPAGVATPAATAPPAAPSPPPPSTERRGSPGRPGDDDPPRMVDCGATPPMARERHVRSEATVGETVGAARATIRGAGPSGRARTATRSGTAPSAGRSRPSTSIQWCDHVIWPTRSSNVSIPTWSGSHRRRLGQARRSGGGGAAGTPTVDDEAAARLEVGGGVGEHGDVLVLRGDVHDRVQHDVDEREHAGDPGRRHVADRHRRWPSAPGLARQLLGHVRRQLDAAAPATPAGAQRQGDTAGADGQLERRAFAGQLGEQVDGRVEHRRIEHRRRTGVVGLGDVAAPGDRRQSAVGQRPGSRGCRSSCRACWRCARDTGSAGSTRRGTGTSRRA